MPGLTRLLNWLIPPGIVSYDWLPFDLDLWRLLSTLSVPLASFSFYLGMGWHPCCCGNTGNDCIYCGTGTAPATIELTFASVANLGTPVCTTCTDFNSSTFAVEQTFANSCIWDITSVPCTASSPSITKIELELSIGLNVFTRVRVLNSNGNADATFIKSYPAASYPDCQTDIEQTINSDNLLSADDVCEWGSATCTVAVP